MDEGSGKSIKSLRALAVAEGECRRCPLYRDATQAVPGEGPKQADFMLVGEQPNDKEDLAGEPFVGPAGRILDSALNDAGIAREDTFVTNADWRRCLLWPVRGSSAFSCWGGHLLATRWFWFWPLLWLCSSPCAADPKA